MHQTLDAIVLNSPPWEALISQLAEATPSFWHEWKERQRQGDLDSLPALVLGNGVDARALGKRSLPAFERWRKLAGSNQVDITGVRALANALGELGNGQIKLRGAKQGITVAFYVAPRSDQFPKLLYAANRAISAHPPLLRSLLCGLVMFAIHPFVDGNGRGARMYWVSGLYDAGYSATEISKALETFYGESRIASMVAINCANSGGTSLSFVKRWHQILSELQHARISQCDEC